MSTPVHKTDLDEPPEERSVRLREMADDLDAATDDLDERAMLAALAREESHLARFVDLDWPKCRKGLHGWCDSGRAFGVIQAHKVPRDTTRRELFRIGIERLRRGGNFCASKGLSYAEGSFSIYATGKRTLFFVWPKSRSWGFWIPGRGHVGWKERLAERGIPL